MLGRREGDQRVRHSSAGYASAAASSEPWRADAPASGQTAEMSQSIAPVVSGRERSGT